MDNDRSERDVIRFLESRGIHIRGYFKIADAPSRYYRLTQSGEVIGLDEESAALSADDVWEALERIQKVPRAEFEAAQEAYRDERRALRGQPTSRTLQTMAEAFAHQYTAEYEKETWQEITAYDEETIRRLLAAATDFILGKGANRKVWQRQFDKMFRDVVLAKVSGQARKKAK